MRRWECQEEYFLCHHAVRKGGGAFGTIFELITLTQGFLTASLVAAATGSALLSLGRLQLRKQGADRSLKTVLILLTKDARRLPLSGL